jgi:hypothetical protein
VPKLKEEEGEKGGGVLDDQNKYLALPFLLVPVQPEFVKIAYMPSIQSFGNYFIFTNFTRSKIKRLIKKIQDPV